MAYPQERFSRFSPDRVVEDIEEGLKPYPTVAAGAVIFFLLGFVLFRSGAFSHVEGGLISAPSRSSLVIV